MGKFFNFLVLIMIFQTSSAFADIQIGDKVVFNEMISTRYSDRHLSGFHGPEIGTVETIRSSKGKIIYGIAEKIFGYKKEHHSLGRTHFYSENIKSLVNEYDSFKVGDLIAAMYKSTRHGTRLCFLNIHAISEDGLYFLENNNHYDNCYVPSYLSRNYQPIRTIYPLVDKANGIKVMDSVIVEIPAHYSEDKPKLQLSTVKAIAQYESNGETRWWFFLDDNEWYRDEQLYLNNNMELGELKVGSKLVFNPTKNHRSIRFINAISRDGRILVGRESWYDSPFPKFALSLDEHNGIKEGDKVIIRNQFGDLEYGVVEIVTEGYYILKDGRGFNSKDIYPQLDALHGIKVGDVVSFRFRNDSYDKDNSYKEFITGKTTVEEIYHDFYVTKHHPHLKRHQIELVR